MKCPECNAAVKFEGNVTQMDCPYCGASIERPAPPAPAGPLGALLEDRNGNGIPDIFEGMGQGSAVNITTTARVESMFIVNGVQYKSLNDMPADVRAQYEQITGALGSGHMFELPKAVQGSRVETTPHEGAAAERPAAARTTTVKTAFKVKTTMSAKGQQAATEDAQEKTPFNVAIYALLGVIALGVAGAVIVWLVAAVR